MVRLDQTAGEQQLAGELARMVPFDGPVLNSASQAGDPGRPLARP
jgi:hypothetical protein